MPRKEEVNKLIKSSDTFFSDGNWKKARELLEEARSICEDCSQIPQIHRKIGAINDAEGKAISAKKRKSGGSVGESSLASSRAQLSSSSKVRAASRSISKSTQSSSPAHDVSVYDVFSSSSSGSKSSLEQNKRTFAFDSSQESRRVSNICSDRDISMIASGFGTVAKIKGYDFDNDELREVASEGLQKLAKKRKSQSKGELSEKPCNKSNDLANELVSKSKKVTRKSLNPESSLDNTPARTGLDKSLSVSKHKRSPTYKVDNPVVVLGASCTTEQGQSSLNLQQDVCKLEEKSGDSIESERLVQPSFQHDPDAADMSDFDGLSTDKNSKRQLEECSISSIAKRGR